jgi:putative restriction endonuclease
MRTTDTPPCKPGAYDDRIPPDGLLHYKYRGDDPEYHKNQAPKAAMNLGLPLIRFAGVASGVYEPRGPSSAPRRRRLR